MVCREGDVWGVWFCSVILVALISLKYSWRLTDLMLTVTTKGVHVVTVHRTHLLCSDVSEG